MADIEEIQKDIIIALKPLGLDKVILFGSHAYIPQSYKEKRALVWNVSSKILLCVQ